MQRIKSGTDSDFRRDYVVCMPKLVTTLANSSPDIDARFLPNSILQSGTYRLEGPLIYNYL